VKTGGTVVSERRAYLVVLVYSLAAAGAASSAAGPAGLNETALEAKLAPCLCRVTVQNAWGVPLALGSGFVLGNGRFVVTELGILARPGTARAAIRFQDGTQVVTEQFGMADPVSGLAALSLKPGASAREGLALAQQVPPLAAAPTVATATWGEGNQPALATGRLVAGPKMSELAARTGVGGLEADWTFLRIARRDAVGASGMPVLDGEGAVLGVRIDVAGRGTTAPLVVPATALRDALFASARELKPLTQLPEAAWAVPIFRLEGRPVTASEFAQIARDLDKSLVCQTCNGKGTVASSSIYGYLYSPGRSTCAACGGDGITCAEGTYAKLKAVAEACTRVAWAPHLEGRAKKAILADGIRMLKKLGRTGARFQRDWADAVQADLATGDGFPRGIVIRALVAKTIDGPDGRYTLVETTGARKSVIFPACAVTDPSVPGPVGSPAEPLETTPIVLGGVAQAQIGSEKSGGPAGLGAAGTVYVLPFGWAPARPVAAGRGAAGTGAPDEAVPDKGPPETHAPDTPAPDTKPLDP